MGSICRHGRNLFCFPFIKCVWKLFLNGRSQVGYGSVKANSGQWMSLDHRMRIERVWNTHQRFERPIRGYSLAVSANLLMMFVLWNCTVFWYWIIWSYDHKAMPQLASTYAQCNLWEHTKKLVCWAAPRLSNEPLLDWAFSGADRAFSRASTRVCILPSRE